MANSPGCILAVIKDGAMVYERGYGMANLEHSVPIDSETVFRIGSVSKQFTAMCIALLAEKNMLSLDDGIRKYIPELPKYAESITIRHMIHHTSGIRSYTDLYFLALFTMNHTYFDPITKEEVFEMLARQKKPLFKSGEQWEYNNSNYFLLGMIVERVSGRTLREFAHESIFEPLGMRNTHYHDDRKMVVPNRAYGYAFKEGKFEISMSNNEVVGDGAVFTTVKDLLLWDSNFYHNRLPGGNDLIATMESVGSLNNGEPHTYAFGLVNARYKGLQVIHHGGGWAGFRAYVGRYPEQKFTIIILANLASVDSQNIALSIASLFLKEHMTEEDQPTEQVDAPERVELADKQLDELVGMYLTSVSSFVGISRMESNLQVTISGMEDSPTTYVPISETQFRPVEGLLPGSFDVEVNEDKQTQLMYNRPDGSRSTWVPIPKIIPAHEIRDYVGHYYSKELDTKFELKTVDDSKLTCAGKHPWSDELELHKLKRDELVLLGVRFQFRRNKKKQVVGFDLLLKPNTSGIRFRKKQTV
jgi:CubicO group peptidase (beta-lactamase class C family)